MFNIKLTIEYDGANYGGWQIQKSKVKTIQGTIEQTLKKLFKEDIKLIGSGRTDAGVHALGQVANFKIRHKIPPENLQRALNSNLPKDIVITKAEAVGLNFHSRFNAKSKVYRYRILNRACPSALLRNKVFFCHYPLNVVFMRKEAKRLLGKHDFKSFCAKAGDAKNSVRVIKRIDIKRRTTDYGLRTIDCIIEADGFLYNMVRNIVGTLLEVGRGKMPAGSAKKILNSKNRNNAGPTAPAEGLCLLEVKY